MATTTRTIWDIAAVPSSHLPATEPPRFVTAHEDGRVRLWSTDLGIPIFETQVGAPVRSVAIHPEPFEGDLLLGLGRVDGTIERIAVAKPENSPRFTTPLGAIHEVRWVGDVLLGATESGSIIRVHEDRCDAISTGPGSLLSVSTNAAGTRAALGTIDKAVRFVDLSRPFESLWECHAKAPFSMVWSVELTGDHRILAARGADVVMLDPTQPPSDATVWRVEASSFASRIAAVGQSPDGRYIAHGHGTEVVIRDPAGDLLKQHAMHVDTVQAICWLNGDTLVSSDDYGDLYVWQIGKSARRLRPSDDNRSSQSETPGHGDFMAQLIKPLAASAPELTDFMARLGTAFTAPRT